MELGAIKRGKEIGSSQRGFYIWHACVDCGKERWVLLINKDGMRYPKHERCYDCGLNSIHQFMEKSSRWKGGRRERKDGYIQVQLAKDDFFYPMANSHGTILEHRLLMAKHLSRCLVSWEVVHHINGIRGDNRIENLRLLPSRAFHVIDTQIKVHIRQLEKRIILLEQENTLLKEQKGGAK